MIARTYATTLLLLYSFIIFSNQLGYKKSDKVTKPNTGANNVAINTVVDMYITKRIKHNLKKWWQNYFHHHLRLSSPEHFFSINQLVANIIRITSNTKLTVWRALTSYSKGNPGSQSPLRTPAKKIRHKSNKVNNHPCRLTGTNHRP